MSIDGGGGVERGHAWDDGAALSRFGVETMERRRIIGAMTDTQVLDMAQHRYLTDADFHAEVERAVYMVLTERTMRFKPSGASEDEMAFARMSVATALLLRERGTT